MKNKMDEKRKRDGNFSNVYLDKNNAYEIQWNCPDAQQHTIKSLHLLIV